VLPGQTCRAPLRSTLPTPGAIEALVAFVDNHVRVVHWPCTIAAGLAERDTLGAGGGGSGAGVTATVAAAVWEPPAPVAVII